MSDDDEYMEEEEEEFQGPKLGVFNHLFSELSECRLMREVETNKNRDMEKERLSCQMEIHMKVNMRTENDKEKVQEPGS